jgi:hypothetical protein
MEQIDKVGRVFRQPVGGLDVAQRGGRALVADKGALAVPAAVAEPLFDDLLAGDLIVP